ncbi:urease accessory protein UreE [Pelistega europaea]|uniref:Urease accessory protein UreE n=1 Tax=Pelistega europaea TaxID=106147 RepID=A0A7Y4LBL1_9BURK|nr:urease accessory protein UreE [Pelistega europaea]NOL50507.1 urease accessory protein UreE [Pelistega europaea]
MEQLPIIEHIVGKLADLQKTGVVGTKTIDYVSLQWFECDRNILRKQSHAGREVAFRLLKEGQRLSHDDVVFIGEDCVLVVEILPSQVIVLSPKTLPEMARACYEIGNKHSPLFLDGNEVLLPYDKPMFEWLEAAGFYPHVEQRRLSYALRANSAPGHGVGHSHGHGEHSHGYVDHVHTHTAHSHASHQDVKNENFHSHDGGRTWHAHD